MIKQIIRFIILQILITWVTILYFDKFLIGTYLDGFTVIAENLMEDRDRFYSFLNPDFVKIDLYLSIFVLLFLIILYSSKFYSYVNELTFSINENLLDEFISIYLLWTSSLLIFFQIFRFNTISRAYLIGLTILVPLILLIFRNSEFLSSILGRNPSKESSVLVNIDESSQLREMRLLKFRNTVAEISINNEFEKQLIKKTEKLFKEIEVNLLVINLGNLNKLNIKTEEYLLNLNKKILLVSKNKVLFNNNFISRSEKFKNQELIYINNDIQYGRKYIVKRLLDISITLILMPLIILILLLSFVFIYLKDGRPFIYQQTRVGLHGKNFQMYKIRTMKKDTHELRQELKTLNKKSGPLFKIENDPRIIQGAKLLRSLSIDELPQFFNILKGEMSIVGPRPLFPEDNYFYDKHYIRRLNVLPGLTGLLQVNDRNTDEFETWFKYDLEYIEKWSLLLDLKIILSTPFALFRNKTKGE